MHIEAAKVEESGDKLGMRNVLEGSVRKAAVKIRINAQLIAAATGHHLWAKRLDGRRGDVFTLQDMVN